MIRRLDNTNCRALWCCVRASRATLRKLPILPPSQRLGNSRKSSAVNPSGKHKGSLTVAISLFNYRDYIIPCLESVKSQTLKDLDLIVVDDCSTDSYGRDQLA